MPEAVTQTELNIEIDGQALLIHPKKTILEAALANGINVPRLCNDPRLKPNAKCGMCAVEVAGVSGTVKACETKIVDGMVIKTHTDALVNLRRKRLDEMFADHWADCIAPCRLVCPAGTDAQGYIGLIAQKRYRDAVALIKQTNPFPGIIGRICTRPCESVCRRNLAGGSVSICWLKRFVADKDRFSDMRFRPEVKAPTGKKVAIVGSGAAGLAAAYYLAIEGHKTVVFEAMPQAGGMLRYGIPSYRLPKDVLDDEINELLELGVEIRTDQRLGRDLTLDELQSRYDAVFLGLGAQAGVRIHVENEDVMGVMRGINFLRGVGLQGKIELGKRVAVTGGGNVAIDSARTALRLGAEKVYLIYRRTRDQMPANDVEIEEAEQEGIEFVFLTSPIRVIGSDRVKGVECIRMVPGDPDVSGRPSVKPQPGSEFVLAVDNLITAVGQVVTAEGAEITLIGKTIGINKRTMQTTVPGVFAAGDAVSSPDVAIQAVTGGRRAAHIINQYLLSPPNWNAWSDGSPEAAHVINQYLTDEERDSGLAKPFSAVRMGVTKEDIGVPSVARIPMPELELSKRQGLGNFAEVELGLSEEDALKEVQRCLECGCIKQNDCDLRDLAIEHGTQPNENYGTMRHFTIDKSHPVVLLNQNKCIQCRKCVQICDEVVGVGAFEYREAENDIVPTGNIPLAETKCEACGQCISACPTAALVENRPKFAREFLWPPKVTTTTCTYCGVGCTLELNTDHAGKVFRVTQTIGEGVNKGNLCGKGRFGYHFISHPDRLTTPLIRKDGQLVPATWDEAINLVAAKLFEAKSAFGADSVAGLTSARCTNEENYLFQKLLRAVVGTNNVDHCARL